MTADSQAWVLAASKGDARAVDALLAEYLPDLERYLARHAGGLLRAKESSSDLAQSVCREVLEHLRGGRFRYRGEAQFRQWLYRAAVMKLMNRRRFWRAERRDAELELAPRGSSAPAIEELARHSATPSRAAELRDELALFQRAFEALPDHYQDVIEWHHVEELTHAEIAERLGTSEANSRMLLSRALARLARVAARPERD